MKGKDGLELPWWLFLICIVNVLLGEENLGRVFLEGRFHLKERFGFLHASWHLVLHDDCRNTCDTIPKQTKSMTINNGLLWASAETMIRALQSGLEYFHEI